MGIYEVFFVIFGFCFVFFKALWAGCGVLENQVWVHSCGVMVPHGVVVHVEFCGFYTMDS